MDTEDSYKTNLNTIKEMILDEEKIVSYITISRDLCIHVNSSKRLLSSAVHKIHEEYPNIKLSISYIISGLTANNTATTTICSENDFGNLQKSFKTVFFHHIYSICKGSKNIDSVALLLLNKYEDYSLCQGTVKSKECMKRTSVEIGNLKINSQDAVVLESKPSVMSKNLKQEAKPASDVKNGQVEEIKVEKLPEVKSVTKIKVEVISPKKESNNKQSNVRMNGNKNQKNIASFFNKPNCVPSRKESKSVSNNNENNGLQKEKLPSKPEKMNEHKMDVDENIDIEIVTNSKINVEKVKTAPNIKEEKKLVKEKPVSEEKNKVLNKIKKSSKVDKKRKRVLHVSDSEDDDENDPFVDNQETCNTVNNVSDDEIPSTPLPANMKITSGIVNPKKRRKVVDKTYTDADGYILTKKEEVYESCSDNEVEIQVEQNVKPEKEVKKVEIETSPSTKKNSPKKTKKKISPPQKGKQPTLNSFFSRK